MPSKAMKLGVYLDAETADMLRDAAAGMDRSVSWLVQHAIRAQVPGMVRKYFNILEDIEVDTDETP